MESKKFDVKGMTCASCVAHVEKSVSKISGIKNLNVQLLDNSMSVTYDETAVTTDMILRAVQDAGYQADIRNATTKTAEFGNSLKDRLRYSVILLLPLLYVSMGSMIGLPMPNSLTDTHHGIYLALIQLALTLPIAIINRVYFISGFRTLFKAKPNMDSLIAIGTSAAIIYSLYNMSAIVFKGSHLVHDLYFESAATILTLITLGKYLEAGSKRKTRDSISALLDLSPKTALIMLNGIETEVPADQLNIGDTIILKPGKTAPVDGVVIEGSTSVDESALTGESIPVYKQVGDTIMSAVVNQNGYLLYKATKVGNDTTISQIIKLVEEASSSKAPVSRLADKVSAIFVPVVLAISLIATVSWLLLGYPLDFALTIGISVLVISCPCALGLATPVAIMVGTGKGAENGLLFRSSEALEILHKANTVVLDKTGTVTTGKIELQEIFTAETFTSTEVLNIAASLEARSEHPFAQAVVKKAGLNLKDLPDVDDFVSHTGHGVSGFVDGKKWAVGNKKLMSDFGIWSTNHYDFDFLQITNQITSQAQTPVYLADDNGICGVLSFSDTLKPDSAQAISELKKLGLKVVMLTGDNRSSANAIAAKAGIETVYSEVLPSEKERVITKLQKQFEQAGNSLKTVIMVGDGINDAPALVKADVGIAIGAGSDIALESSDVVLMKNSLMDVVNAIKLSRNVMTNIKQNLFWAFFYNVLGIPIAAGLLFGLFGIKLNPVFAAAAMSLSSVTVVLNALRIKRFTKTVNITTETISNNQIISNISTISNKSNESIKPNKVMETKIINIEGMSCKHCSASVEKALNAIDGVEATVDLNSKTATLKLSREVNNEELKDAVEGAGYWVSF